MKRVFVCSPLRADTHEGVTKNVVFAQQLCRVATEWGVAAFASHAFYTLFLDDFNAEHRKAGMEAGRVWLLAAHEVWVHTHRGISSGMQAEIALATDHKIPVIYDPQVWAGKNFNG